MKITALLLTCCCACFGGKKPNYDYFVLTPTSLAKPAAESAASDATVGVSRVAIPRYLDRDAVVTRSDDYRLIYSPQARWAEPLDEAFTRTLRQDLAASLAPSGITVPSHVGAPTYDLQVEVLRFESRGTEKVELWARWTLRSRGELAQTHEARIDVPIASPGSSTAAAALSDAVARLATDIAGHVRVVEAQRDPRRSPGS